MPSPYWPGTSWYKSFGFEVEQETADIAQIEQRATWFYEAVTSTKAWSILSRGKVRHT